MLKYLSKNEGDDASEARKEDFEARSAALNGEFASPGLMLSYKPSKFS
jgi:hypothetical protein